MATQNGAYDEALAGAAGMSPNRQPMGTEVVSTATFPSASPSAGTLVPKKNVAAGDPYAQPKPSRPNVIQDRVGAAYGVSVSYTAQTSPEAGATQAQGRIIKSAVNRSRYNFDDGNATSY
jgi:hypothetical protein